MANKPSPDQLDDPSLFEKIEVVVPVWRSKRAEDKGNLFFKDQTNGVVLDRYVTVKDSSGIPVVTRRRSGAEHFGSGLFRGALAVLATAKLHIPLSVSRALLNVAKGDAVKAAKIKRAVELAKEDDKMDAALVLVDAVGPEQWRSILALWSQLDGNTPVEDFLQELSSEDILDDYTE